MNTFLFYSFAMTWLIGVIGSSVALVLFSINPGINWGLVELFLALLVFGLSLLGMFRTGKEVF